MSETETIELDSDLHKAGVALLEAAAEYWRVAHRNDIHGAISWLDDSKGNTVLFTRGEYRHQLLKNIEAPGEIRYFEHITTDAEFEAEFEAKTPDGLLG